MIKEKEYTFEEIRGNKDIALSLLAEKTPYFVDANAKKDTEKVTINYEYAIEEYKTWDELMHLPDGERMRILLNIGETYRKIADTQWTFEMNPNNILIDRNGLPKIIERGIINQIPPYKKIDEKEFLESYKAMAVSLIDKKRSYEELVDGQLEFYKGTVLAENVIAKSSFKEIMDLLENEYKEIKEEIDNKYTWVSKSKVSLFKLLTGIFATMTIVLFASCLYIYFGKLSSQKVLSNIRLSFIQDDYTSVVSESSKTSIDNLGQDDKYIVAYSAIMTEPLTEEQKKELSKISVQSNQDYLSYWILIGQQKIDEALDIASYLDDPQLMMYGITKKIDEIQRDSEMSAEERTTRIEELKSKLNELKEKYLVEKEETN